MHAIVGLGNPGSEYDGTRHNVGFMVIDALCAKLRISLEAGKGDYLVAKARCAGTPVYLVKPMTYMNNSGAAVREVQKRHRVPLRNLLVVCDDFQLPLGRIRLRVRGSDGGHNGLYSVIDHLQSDGFPRLRCGIANDRMPGEKSEMARFVLSSFRREEMPAVEDMVARAREASLTVIGEGIDAGMNRYNRSR